MAERAVSQRQSHYAADHGSETPSQRPIFPLNNVDEALPKKIAAEQRNGVDNSWTFEEPSPASSYYAIVLCLSGRAERHFFRVQYHSRRHIRSCKRRFRKLHAWNRALTQWPCRGDGTPCLTDYVWRIRCVVPIPLPLQQRGLVLSGEPLASPCQAYPQSWVVNKYRPMRRHLLSQCRDIPSTFGHLLLINNLDSGQDSLPFTR